MMKICTLNISFCTKAIAREPYKSVTATAVIIAQITVFFQFNNILLTIPPVIPKSTLLLFLSTIQIRELLELSALLCELVN